MVIYYHFDTKFLATFLAVQDAQSDMPEMKNSIPSVKCAEVITGYDNTREVAMILNKLPLKIYV
jgi:hypothetical protein